MVVEGNRRTTALRGIRARLEKEHLKLERIKGGRGHSAGDVVEQQRLVQQIQQIIADTENIPIAARHDSVSRIAV